MSAMDILVMPSRREPRGLVAIEAMAAGAATIVSSATGVWGAGDVIQHEHTGLVYPAGDVDRLAHCLSRLMSDVTFRKRLARDGRAAALRCGPRDFAVTAATSLAATARSRTSRERHTNLIERTSEE
jgi:glycosyltransferase involved in cell wall biosynthesis